MSDGIKDSFVDFAAVSFDFDRVRCILLRSFLVRNWCGPRPTSSPSTTLFRPRIPDPGWCRVVAPAKRPVEVREVIEAEFECDRADRAARMQRASQNAKGARQALAEYELRVGDALALEQLVQIAHRHVIAGRDFRRV